MAGLGTALACARDGHRRDDPRTRRDADAGVADAAFEWQRRGAPQVRHSHAFLARAAQPAARPRARRARRRCSPPARPRSRSPRTCPPTLTDRSPRPGDEDLVALACRRTTFEWVLRRAVLAQPGVELRDGVARRAPRRRRRGSRRASPASTASTPISSSTRGGRGRRRTPGSTAIGAAPVAEELHESGIVYFSRFYRLVGAADAPAGGEHGRRRPRLPQVRGLPRRQRHVLDHVRGRHARRRAAPRARRPGRVRGRGAAARRRRAVAGARASPSRSPTCT